MTLKQVLINRDEMTSKEANEAIAHFKVMLNELLDEGGTYDDACDLIESEFGLEPDYLEEFLFDMV